MKNLSFPTTSNAKTAAAVVAVAATTTALWAARKSTFRRKRRADRKEGCEKIRLLPSEISFVVKTSPPMSSITFFETTNENEDIETSRAYFEERTKAIVDANPWLAGFIDADEAEGNLALFVPQGSKKRDSSSFFSFIDTLGPLPEDYHAMVEMLGEARIGNTVEHVASFENSGDERWEPLWKVAFVPGTWKSGKNGFGLVVSGNHSLLDGHGYYKLFRMLSCEEPIASLSPVRRHDLAGPIKAVTGNEPSFLEEPSAGFLLGFITSMIRNAVFPQTKSIGFVVSKDWINSQKEAYRTSIEDATNEDDSPPPPPFLSTNDVVVSSFCRETGCDLALMAINLRGRAEGCTEDLVGNYEHLIGYCKDDCAAPESIRKSVSGPVYERVGASANEPKLPTSLEHLRCTYAVTTSWASFAKELHTSSNATNVKQTLHLPLFDFPQSTPACTYSSMVIFRPKEGETGVLCGGKAALMEKLKASGMVGSMIYEPR